MLIGDAIGRSLDEIAQRERDAMEIFSPGAQPSFDDARAPRRVVATRDPMDVAAPEGTYFVTSAPDGTLHFGEDGDFAVRNGTIVDSGGGSVLGYARPGAPLAELRVDPVDIALGYADSTAIDAEGDVSYERPSIDPRTGASARERVVVGRLALARFPAGTRLLRADARHERAPAGVEPAIGAPGTGGFGALATQHRVMSGVAIDRSLERLHDAYLAFDALRAAGSAQGSTAKVAMDLLK